MADFDPVVDLVFAVQGVSVPADHAYAVYSAISRVLPELHAAPSVGVHPISGQLCGNRTLALTRQSRLSLRLPASMVPSAIRLAGKRLDVTGHVVRVGVPVVRPLEPHARIVSHLVVIKGFSEADGFVEAANRQLAALGVSRSAELIERRGPRPLEGGLGSRERFVRRTVRVHGREIVGFAVRVDALAPVDSLRLQAAGLGGRRRFGCGIFVCWNPRSAHA